MRRKSISHFLTTRITFYILFFLLSLYAAVVKQIVSFLVWIGLKKQLFLFCCAMQVNKISKVPYHFLICLDISVVHYLLYILNIFSKCKIEILCLFLLHTNIYPRLVCKHFRINLQILGFFYLFVDMDLRKQSQLCLHAFSHVFLFLLYLSQVSLSPEQMVCFQL